MTHAPLSPAELAEIDRALCAMAAASSSAPWALAASWALSGPDVLYCLVSTTHFVACGGGGWASIGYDVSALAGTPWSACIASPMEVARSHEIVAHNVATGRGVDAFENHYRHARTGKPVLVRWRISPWRDGHAVARGVICE